MTRELIMGRLVMLPLRHKLIVACIEITCIAGCVAWVDTLPAREYTSSSLLSFDQTVAADSAFGTVQTDQPARWATAILNDEVVNGLCKHFALFPAAGGAQVSRFRSNLMFSPESASSLRVTWRGSNPTQTMAVTNRVAMLLTDWTLDPETSKDSDPIPAIPARVAASTPPPRSFERPSVSGKSHSGISRTAAHSAIERSDQKQLRSELATADRRLAKLGEEAHGLEVRIAKANAERESDSNARQSLTVQLDAEKKKLNLLRVRYTDAYPDVEATLERISEMEHKLATMPLVRSAPEADQFRLKSETREMNELRAEKHRLQSRLLKASKLEGKLRSEEVSGPVPAVRHVQTLDASQSEPGERTLNNDVYPPLSAAKSQSPKLTNGTPLSLFKILKRATDAQPTDSSRYLPTWALCGIASLGGLLYLLAALWRFRVVRSAEALEGIVPEYITYLGAVPGMVTWPRNL